MPAWSAAAAAGIGAVGNIIGGVVGGNSSAIQARAQRKWEESMSNTAVQRRVEDLKKAGMNPMLAFMGSGPGGVQASTPSGATGKGMDFSDLGSKTVQAYQSAQMVKQQVENLQKQGNLTDAQATGTQIDNRIKAVSEPYQAWLNANQGNVTSEFPLVTSRTSAVAIQEKEKQIQHIDAQISQLGVQAKKIEADTNLSVQQLRQNKALMDLVIEAAELANRAMKLGMPEREAFAKYYEVTGAAGIGLEKAAQLNPFKGMGGTVLPPGRQPPTGPATAPHWDYKP